MEKKDFMKSFSLWILNKAMNLWIYMLQMSNLRFRNIWRVFHTELPGRVPVSPHTNQSPPSPLPPPSSECPHDLKSSVQAANIAVKLFFNNSFDEGRSLMKKW